MRVERINPCYRCNEQGYRCNEQGCPCHKDNPKKFFDNVIPVVYDPDVNASITQHVIDGKLVEFRGWCHSHRSLSITRSDFNGCTGYVINNVVYFHAFAPVRKWKKL